MGTDKKSQHVGNHGGAYTDLDGMSKQFTYVDHDPKTKVGAKVISEEEFKEARDMVTDFRESVITDILSYPASLCPAIDAFWVFTVRGDKEKIEWSESALRDPTIDVWKLDNLRSFLQRRKELLK